MASAAGLVAPSTCNENSPLSCIEALSIGTPLIVSANGGLPELVTEPKCGIVIETSPSAIAKALTELLDDREGLTSMSKNALMRYGSQHSPELYMERYLGSMEGVAR